MMDVGGDWLSRAKWLKSSVHRETSVSDCIINRHNLHWLQTEGCKLLYVFVLFGGAELLRKFLTVPKLIYKVKSLYVMWRFKRISNFSRVKVISGSWPDTPQALLVLLRSKMSYRSVFYAASARAARWQSRLTDKVGRLKCWRVVWRVASAAAGGTRLSQHL